MHSVCVRSACLLCKVRRADRHTLGSGAGDACVQDKALIQLIVQVAVRCYDQRGAKLRLCCCAEAVGGLPLARNGAL